MAFQALAADPATATGGIALLATALALGLRHGIDWDHIAAIADITSTTAATEAAEEAHDAVHEAGGPEHEHAHGGSPERDVHVAVPTDGATLVLPAAMPLTRRRLVEDQRRSVGLGSLYAFGHAAVVIGLGLAALIFGAILPSWIDPIMGRVVGVTLVLLGAWVLYSAVRICPARVDVPAAESLDAGLRQRALRMAMVRRQDPWPPPRRTARGELLRRQDGLHGRRHPRHRG